MVGHMQGYVNVSDSDHSVNLIRYQEGIEGLPEGGTTRMFRDFDAALGHMLIGCDKEKNTLH